MTAFLQGRVPMSVWDEDDDMGPSKVVGWLMAECPTWLLDQLRSPAYRYRRKCRVFMAMITNDEIQRQAAEILGLHGSTTERFHLAARVAWAVDWTGSPADLERYDREAALGRLIASWHGLRRRNVERRDRSALVWHDRTMRRTASILACLSVLACAPNQPGLGDEADESGTDEIETDDSETDESETVSESESGESGCEVALDCPVGQTCIAGECTAIPEPSPCEPPSIAPLSLPSAGGDIRAFDIYDIDHDGADELVAWTVPSGIAVLDEGQWTWSAYPEPCCSPALTAIDVDGDDLLDVLLTDLANPMQVALGDGTGSFTFGEMIPGVADGRGVELNADGRFVFGMLLARGVERPGYVRFDGMDPEVVLLDLPPAAGWELVPVRLDAEHEGVAYSDGCSAWPTRVNVDEPVHAIATTPVVVEPHGGGLCSWLNADLDGDARDELVTMELIGGAPPYQTIIGILVNQTEAGAPPSFAAPQFATIPYTHPWGVAADFDGDGDDEILFTRYEPDGADAILVWAEEGQLAGCMAEVPGLPAVVRGIRAGDLDGDGDDELALFTADGALQVLDAG